MPGMTRCKRHFARKTLTVGAILGAALAVVKVFRSRGRIGQMAGAPDTVREAARHLG